MKIETRIPSAVLVAATGMLQPFIPELSPQSLVAALENYETGKPVGIVEKPLTRREVASFLKCSLNTVNRHMNAGRLRRIRLTDRSVRIDPQSVRDLMKCGSKGE